MPTVKLPLPSFYGPLTGHRYCFPPRPRNGTPVFSISTLSSKIGRPELQAFLELCRSAELAPPICSRELEPTVGSENLRFPVNGSLKGDVDIDMDKYGYTVDSNKLEYEGP